MKYPLPSTIVLLAVTVDALVSRGSSCCFHLDGVRQLPDGQNRINQTAGTSPSQYCIDSNGGLTDGNGRGCILTGPTTQFQCDTGATPAPGFSVGCDGTLALNGNNKLSACPTGDNGGYNIYSTAPQGQQACVSVTLSADNCKSNCPAPPLPTPKTCPTDLSGTYEFPHLIVPVDSSKPNTAAGTAWNGTVSSTVSTIFNFDIPSHDTGKTCSLVFLFPTQSQLETSAYEFSGNGGIEFALLNGPANLGTTSANAPGVKQNYGITTVSPGHSYTIATFPCPGNSAIGFEAKAYGDTHMNYFQDYNPAPIGLYITVC